jgi:F-type H+-transporting ATPase subunit gamma
MAVQTRTIKRRIKSVTNTRKITKAMELVAASKMRKAVNSVISTRPYAKLAWDTVKAVSKQTDTSLHPLLRETKDVKSVLLVLLTSDRGLAAGFNSNIIKKTIAEVEALGEDVKFQTICVGKRGAEAMKRADKTILASFVGITNNTKFEEVLPIGKMIINEFTKENFDKVLIAYTDYVSAVTQNPIILELLPLSSEENLKEIGDVKTSEEEPEIQRASEYTFEPSPEEVLNQILPRLVETTVYQAVLESAASEHSARMMAMRSASDAAGDMIDDLTFTFNQARQASITQEIAEISSGKAALEG